MDHYHDNSTPHISHITLRVSSLEHSKKYYMSVFPFVLKDETSEQVILGTKDKSLLTLMKAKKNNLYTEGLYHIAFLLPSMEDLAKWFLYQQARNLIIYGASDHLVSRAFYLTDPDGNGIEVYADTDERDWDVSDNAIKMDTLPLDIKELIKGVTKPKTLDMDITIGHLHLKTKDAQKMGEFYQSFGLKPTQNMGHAVFLSFHNYHHHLAFNQWNRNKMMEHQNDDVDIDQFTIQYPSEQAMYNVIRQLSLNQVTVLNDNEQIVVYDPMNLKVVLTYYSLPQ